MVPSSMEAACEEIPRSVAVGSQPAVALQEALEESQEAAQVRIHPMVRSFQAGQAEVADPRRAGPLMLFVFSGFSSVRLRDCFRAHPPHRADGDGDDAS